MLLAQNLRRGGRTQALLETHNSAQVLPRCCTDLGLSLPCPNDVEYQCCEMRQLEHERDYAGGGGAAKWYRQGIQTAAFRGALGWDPVD